MITDIYHKHKGVFFFYLDIMKYQKYFIAIDIFNSKASQQEIYWK